MQAQQSCAQLVVKSSPRKLLQRSNSFRLIEYICLIIFNPEIVKNPLYLVTHRQPPVMLLLIGDILGNAFYL